jgi:hypothetical protein
MCIALGLHLTLWSSQCKLKPEVFRNPRLERLLSDRVSGELAGMKRVLPISSIRFLLAVWVFLSHFPYPILSGPQRTQFRWAARSLLHNSFDGPATVMAFFVISGV